MVFERIEALLGEMEQRGELRSPEDGGLRVKVKGRASELGRAFVDLSSNDYLGMAGGAWREGCGGSEVIGVASNGSGGGGESAVLPEVSRETSIGTKGSRNASGQEASPTGQAFLEADPRRSGAGASRLLGGTHPEHLVLEEQLAQWVGYPEALIFSSGYSANLGLLSSLPQPEDLVFSDSLNHASIIDGCRLSKAKTAVYAHRNLEMLEAMLRDSSCLGDRWVVTETYFSMDGDRPDLVELRRLCDRYQAGLILDEAHALGIFGPSGAGLAADAGIKAEALVGAFGKAVGLQGAFVAGPKVLKRWLWNRARSFVFSTAPAPSLTRQLMLHVKQVQAADASRQRLLELVARIRGELQRRGLPVHADSFGPIIPLVIGDSNLALEVANRCRTQGILVYPVRPPTVPEGTARLRVTVTAALDNASVERILDVLAEAVPHGPR